MEMTPRISVAIPVRAGGNPYTTLRSLGIQEGVDLEVLICHDEDGRGANWARNRAAALARAPLLLFSDDDITWQPGALHCMAEALKHAGDPDVSYVYGSWEMAGRIQSTEFWSARLLRRRNYISTMTLMKREHFPGFDEQLGRLQDWDLWLTLLSHGRCGLHCGRQIFSTTVRPGITHNGAVSWADAKAAIVRKHNLI
jgi:hypothetical protein